MSRPAVAVVVALGIVTFGVDAGAFNIVIDPGHGGSDPGAVGCSLEEAEINLDVSLRLKALLEQNGQQVSVTRSTDTAVSLGGRSDFANSRGADRFASIHSNAFSDPAANGTETFCHTSGGTSIDMRDKIQREMIEAWGLTNRGGKTANFSVLSNTVMPATLSELGFVTNCGVDATFLRDNTRRGQAAQAHLDAIAAHLGFAIDDTPAPTTGELKGVVFHDVGVGTADMTRRLATATVRVVGRADVVTAGTPDADWSFDLPAGTYSIRAEAAGFVTAERACDALASGGVRFCSIGLVPEPTAGEGEGEGEPTEGEGEPVGEGEGEFESGEGEGEIDPAGAGVQRVIIRNRPAATGGCDCNSSSDLGISAGALIMIGLLRRRRRRSALLSVGVLGAALGLSTPGLAVTTQSAPLLKIEAARQLLVDERVVFQGVAASVVPSPSGQRLLVSDDHYEGLTVVDVKTGAQTTLSTSSRAGFRALWIDDQNVAHRVPQAPFGGQPLLLLDAQTGKFRGPHFEHKSRAVVQTDDDVILIGARVDEAGRLANPVRLSPTNDRCFAPQLVGDVVVFQCLESGVWIARATQDQLTAGAPEHWRIGDGAQLSLSHDGKTLVFLVASDEGHEILQADVVVVDLSGKVPTAAVLQTARIERAPGVSDVHADGSRTLAFVVDNDVTVATLKR